MNCFVVGSESLRVIVWKSWEVAAAAETDRFPSRDSWLDLTVADAVRTLSEPNLPLIRMVLVPVRFLGVIVVGGRVDSIDSRI